MDTSGPAVPSSAGAQVPFGATPVLGAIVDSGAMDIGHAAAPASDCYSKARATLYRSGRTRRIGGVEAAPNRLWGRVARKNPEEIFPGAF